MPYPFRYYVFEACWTMNCDKVIHWNTLHEKTLESCDMLLGPPMRDAS